MAEARKRVVVTGGNGNLGRFVVRELEKDCDVTVIDRSVSGSNAAGAVDIRDKGRLQEVLNGQDAIVHLAALDIVMEAPDREFFDVNCRGTWSLYEAAVACGVGTIVHCSTATVYGLDHSPPGFKPAYLPVDESHPIYATDRYGITKRFAEMASAIYAGKHGMTVCSIRLTGVVFPRTVDDLSRLLGQESEKWQTLPAPVPESIPSTDVVDVAKYCDYIDVRDAARLFRAALDWHKGEYAAYNGAALDTLVPYETLEFVRRIDGGLPPIKDEAWFKRDARASPLSTARAQEQLGWRPIYTWRESRGSLRASGES